MEVLYVIKIGGNIIDDEQKLLSFLESFASVTGRKILVHGGGKLATSLAETMGVPQEMMDGRRITSESTLRIVTMVYAGLINKNIAARLQAEGCNAIGLSGADGNAILADKRIAGNIDYGFAGDITRINTRFIADLVWAELVPVFSAITHDGKGQLLNSNADTIAQEIAKSMATTFHVELIYCFEKQGLLMNPNDENSVIPKVNAAEFERLKRENIVTKGMIPKLDNAFAALDAGVQQVKIGDAMQLHALISNNAGTAIVHDRREL